MALFLGSVLVFALVVLALSASLLIKGQALKVGCGKACDNPACDHPCERHGTSTCQRGHT